MIEINAVSSSSKGNCYRVTDGKTPLLLECGITFKEMQRAFDFKMSFAGCLITHEHGDHCKALKDVLRAGIDCYMSHGTAKALGVENHHRINLVKARQAVRIGTWLIMPFDVQHDVSEPYGFLLANEDGDKVCSLPLTPITSNISFLDSRTSWLSAITLKRSWMQISTMGASIKACVTGSSSRISA